MKSYFLLPIFLFLLLSPSWAQLGGPTPSQEEEQPAIELVETEDGYTPIDDGQVTSNPQLQGLVYIGVQNVTQQAIQAGTLPEGSYQVSQIVSAAQNQDSYRFEVEVASQGNTADILFFITYDTSAGTTEVISYEVLGNEGGEGTTELGEVPEVGELGEGEFEGGEQTDDEFVVLDPSLADTNPVLRGVLILGVQEATKQAIANGSLYDSNYQLVDVNSIEQGVENPDEYKFDVNVINDLQNTVRMNFDLTYNSDSNTVQVLSFGYPDVTTPGEETETEEVFEETPPILEETPEIEVGEQEQTEDGFVILDPSIAQTDTEIAGILNLGVQEATSQAIANGSLYDSPYELAQVYSAQQNIANPDNYRFDVSVRNNLQNTVRMDFDLTYDESSNTVEILSWGYPNTTIPDNGEEVIPPIEEEENSTGNNGTSGGVDGIPAGYQEVSFDPNDSNSFIYQVGEAGLIVVVAQGSLDETIPSSYYVANNIRSVSQKVEGTKTFYRFDLDAADTAGNSARFTYIVSYDMATAKPNLESSQITNVVRAS